MISKTNACLGVP